jgi:hypothetical protein
LTKDELKKKLRSAFAIQKQIEAEYVELQNLRDNASRITPAYSLAPGGSGTGQRIENAMAKIVDAENIIQSEMEILMVALGEIRQLISLVDDPILRLILHKRYLCYQKWEQIATDLSYTWVHTHRLHGKALNAILKKML